MISNFHTPVGGVWVEKVIDILNVAFGFPIQNVGEIPPMSAVRNR